MNIAKDFVDALKGKEKTSAYDTPATVIRTEGNTAWVHIPGGVDETPVRMTMTAAAGETVQVRVSGGTAYLIGNESSPPTDDRKAVAAQHSADAAAQTAEQANETAGLAAVAAKDAQESAASAAQSAVRANTYANSALNQLGIVQDVVGVLNWAAEHGTFVRTADTSPQEGKVYFIYDPVSGDYTPVVEPEETQIANYYELTVDEAMQDFVMAHLAVTQRGLWVLPSGINTGQVSPQTGETEADARARLGSNYKVLLSNSGMTVYDGSGTAVATYGESIRFDDSRPQYIGNENAYIVFNPANNSISIGGNVLMGNEKSLSDMMAELSEVGSKVSNTLIYDHAYEYIRDANHNPVSAVFTAFLYRAGVDVKTEYDPECFTWYLKREDTDGVVRETQLDPGYGYTANVTLDQCGYGAEVIGKFSISDEAGALNTNGDNITDSDNDPLTVRATGDSVRVRDLTVVSTIFPSEKLMVIGAEDEHLVSVQSLQDYLAANLTKQVLFDTTASWDSQTTLTSDANTLYIYTDHGTDSKGNAVAGIKAGDGLAYVCDLPFTDAVMMEHIADPTVHITAAERTFWNNKVSCFYTGQGQLIFTTT